MLTLSVRFGRWGRLGAAMSNLLVHQLWLWFAFAGKHIGGLAILLTPFVSGDWSVLYFLSESMRLNIQQN